MQRFLRAPDRVLQALTVSENNIYQYLHENLGAVYSLSISDISTATYTSPSAVFNVLKKLGYSGFKEFKYVCINYQEELTAINNLVLNDNLNNCLSGQKQLIETIQDQEYEQICARCHEIKHAKHVLVIANEITRFVAKDFVYRMQLCGVNIIGSYDHKQYEVLLQQGNCDYIIVFSKHGNTEKIIKAFEQSQQKIDLLITSNENSYSLELATSALIAHSVKTCSVLSDVYGDIGSRTELMLLGDIIINTYIQNYAKE